MPHASARYCLRQYKSSLTFTDRKRHVARFMAQRTLPPPDPQALLKQFLEIAVTGEEIEKASNEPVDWVWPPYVASGSICLVAGNTSGGKTSFIFLLLAARTASKPIEFLGHLVTPAPAGQYIVVVEPEHSKGSSARKFKKSARLLGLDSKEVFKRLIIVSGSRSLVVGDLRWRQLCGLIRAGLVSDVLLDTIASTTTEEGSDEQAQAALFDKLRLAIENAPPKQSPPVIWPCTHTRKPSKDADEEIDLAAVSGSLQRAAQSNTVLMLRANRRDYKIVSATIFFLKTKEEPVEGFKDHELTPKTFTVGHDRLQLLGKKITNLVDVIYDMLCLAPDGLSMSGLGERTKRNKPDIRTALDTLIKNKKVRRGGEEGGDGSSVTLFFAIFEKKSTASEEGGRIIDKTTKKEGGLKGGAKGGRKPSTKAQVIDINRFRDGGADK